MPHAYNSWRAPSWSSAGQPSSTKRTAGQSSEEIPLRAGGIEGVSRPGKPAAAAPRVHRPHETQPPELLFEPAASGQRTGPIRPGEFTDVPGVVGFVRDGRGRTVFRERPAERQFHRIERLEAEVAQVLAGLRRIEDVVVDDGQIGGRPARRTRQKRGGAAVHKGRDVGAVLQPDQWEIGDPGAPHAVLAKGFVEFPNPAFALRLQEIGIQTPENAVEPEGPHPHLVLENAAQLVGAPCRHFVGEPLGATGVFEEGGQLFRPEEVAEPPGACQAGALPRHEAAAEARQERLPAERRRDRLTEGGKQRAVGQPVAAERQRTGASTRRAGCDRAASEAHPSELRRSPRRGFRSTGRRPARCPAPEWFGTGPAPEIEDPSGGSWGKNAKSGVSRSGTGSGRPSSPSRKATSTWRSTPCGGPGTARANTSQVCSVSRWPSASPTRFHSPHSAVRRVGVAQVEARGAVRDPPLDLLDLAKEKESAGSEAPHRLPDLAGVGESPEREHEKRLVRGTGDQRGRRDRQHVVLKGEILPARMHFGPVGEGVHRLEADAEATDLGEPRILGALPNAANAPHVGFVEGKAEMADPQFGCPAGRGCLFRGPVARDAGLEAPTGRTGGVPWANVELDGARTGPVLPPRERVLCVLQEFVDEVGAVAVTMRQQLVSVVPDPRPVAAFVLAVDRPVVGGHCLNHNLCVTTKSVAPPSPQAPPGREPPRRARGHGGRAAVVRRSPQRPGAARRRRCQTR